MTTRTANLLGALATALVDRVSDSTTSATLVTLFNSPGLNVGDVARVIGLSHAGTVRVIDRLVAEGFVARGRGHDGREVVLQLEPKGRRAARAMLSARAAVLDQALGALSTDDCRTFERIAEQLLKALTPDPDVADHTCRMCDERACPLSSCPVECAIAEQR
jgi:DNA-binding MarR family transcriptional regulator